MGDTLILGTDGLFDNMKMDELLELIAEGDGKQTGLFMLRIYMN